MNNNISFRRGTLLGLLFACSPLLHAELPLITDARVPATPPGAKVAAGYLTVTNSADEPLILESVSSTSVPKVELHLTEIKNDVASMTEQDEITIPAGETLAFSHGGYHLMLMNLEESLMAGDVIDLTLQTSAGEVELSMPVIEPDMPGSDSEMGMEMEEMDMEEMEEMDEMDMQEMQEEGMESPEDGMSDDADAMKGDDHDAMGN